MRTSKLKVGHIVTSFTHIRFSVYVFLVDFILNETLTHYNNQIKRKISLLLAYYNVTKCLILYVLYINKCNVI